MRINKEMIKVEMTSKEYADVIFCLKMNAEKAHISLLSAEARGIERWIDSSTKLFEMAVACYENMSGERYDIYEQELKLSDKIPSLRRF